MKKESIVKWVAFTSILTIFLGTYLKILHYSGADFILSVGLVGTALLLIGAIFEVRTSARLNKNEKMMWTIGLLFITSIALPLYFLNGRKRTIY